MKACQLKSVLAVLLSALLVISCGSGGGGMLASGGIDGTGIISSGVISAFGSIVVNGTKFDTSNAAIIIRGEEIGVGDDIVMDNLDIGRVVIVEGRLSADNTSAVADQVFYMDNVEGPVEGVSLIDDTTKEIVVLGQTVIVNVITSFKETTFETIAKDDVVEISGYLDDTGVIRATFLGKTGDITTIIEYEITGNVANLNTALQIFEINDLMVNYSSIASDLPEGIPADGLFVEVEGTLDAASGVMNAKRIALADELGDGDADTIEVMGFVTDVTSDFEFTVGNQKMQFDAQTVFVDGGPDDIAAGVKLEAEGSLVDGILWADEIEFWEPDQIEVEGFVTNIDSETEFIEFTLEDQGQAVQIQTDAETVFDPEDLIIEEGMRLEVKGFPVDIDHSILIADKVSLEVN